MEEEELKNQESAQNDKGTETAKVSNPFQVDPPAKKVNFVKFTTDLFGHDDTSLFNPYLINNSLKEMNQGEQKYEFRMPDDAELKETGFNSDQIDLFKTSYNEIEKASYNEDYLEYFEKEHEKYSPLNTVVNRGLGYNKFLNKDKLNELDRQKNPLIYYGSQGTKSWFTPSQVGRANTKIEIDGELKDVREFNKDYRTAEDVVGWNFDDRFTLATDGDGRPKLDDNGFMYMRNLQEDERSNQLAYKVESIWAPKELYNSNVLAETLKFVPDFALDAIGGAASILNYANWIGGGTSEVFNPMAHARAYQQAETGSKSYFENLMAGVKPWSDDLDMTVDSRVTPFLKGLKTPGSLERDAGLFDSPINTYLAVLDGLGQIGLTYLTGAGVTKLATKVGGLTTLNKSAPLINQVNRLNAIERTSVNAGRSASYLYNVSNVVRSADESAMQHGLSKAESIAMQTIAALALVMTERLTGEQFMPKMAKSGHIDDFTAFVTKTIQQQGKEAIKSPKAQSRLLQTSVSFLKNLYNKSGQVLKGVKESKTIPGRFITGGIREATQEGSEEAINIQGENLYDNHLTSVDITRYNNKSKENFERIYGGAFIGFITGGLGGSMMKGRSKEDDGRQWSIIKEVVESKGDTSVLQESLKKLYDNGVLDYGHLDKDGNLVQDKDKSAAKTTYDYWVQQINLIESLYGEVIKGQDINDLKKGSITDQIQGEVISRMSTIMASLSLDATPERVNLVAEEYSAFAGGLMIKEGVFTEKALIDIEGEINSRLLEAADASTTAIDVQDAYKLANLKKQRQTIDLEETEALEALDINTDGLTEESLQDEYVAEVLKVREEAEEARKDVDKDIKDLNEKHPALNNIADAIGTKLNLQEFKEKISNGERAAYYTKKGVFEFSLKDAGVEIDFREYLAFEAEMNSLVKQQSVLHKFSQEDNKKKATVLDETIEALDINQPLGFLHGSRLKTNAPAIGITEDQRTKLEEYRGNVAAKIESDDNIDDKLAAELDATLKTLDRILQLPEQNLEMTPQVYALQGKIESLDAGLRALEANYATEQAAFNRGGEAAKIKKDFEALLTQFNVYNAFNPESIQGISGEILNYYNPRLDRLIAISGDDNIEGVQLSRLYDDIQWRNDILINIVSAINETHPDNDIAYQIPTPIPFEDNWDVMSDYKKSFTEFENQLSGYIQNLSNKEIKTLFNQLGYDRITRSVYTSKDGIALESYKMFYFMDLVRGGNFDFNQKYAELEGLYDTKNEFTPSVIQKEYVRWLYSFITNQNETERLVKGLQYETFTNRPGKRDEDGSKLAHDIILFEGYGGVGKTSMVIKTLLELVGLNGGAKYVYTSPGENQLETLEQDGINTIGSTFENEADLSTLQGERLSFPFVLDMLETAAKGEDALDYDFIIIDEATLMSQSRPDKGEITRLINAVDAINSKKERAGRLKVILSGDTGQLFGGKEFTSAIFPERRRPLDAIYRSGKKASSSIQEVIRATNSLEKKIDGLPSTEYTMNGLNIEEGHKWAKDNQETMIAFLNHVNSMDSPTIEDIAFITTTPENSLVQIDAVADDEGMTVPEDVGKFIIDARDSQSKSYKHVYGQFHINISDRTDNYYKQWHKALLVIVSREQKSVMVALNSVRPNGAVSTAVSEGQLDKYDVNDYKKISDPTVKEAKRTQMIEVNELKVRFNQAQIGVDVAVTPKTTTTTISNDEVDDHSDLNENTSKESNEDQQNTPKIVTAFSSLLSQETSNKETDNIFTLTVTPEDRTTGSVKVSHMIDGKTPYDEIENWFNSDGMNYSEDGEIPPNTPVLTIAPAIVELDKDGKWAVKEKGLWTNNPVYFEEKTSSVLKEDNLDDTIAKVETGSDVQNNDIASNETNDAIVDKIKSNAALNEDRVAETLEQSITPGTLTVVVEADQISEDPNSENKVKAFVYARTEDGKQYKIVINDNDSDVNTSEKINQFIKNPKIGAPVTAEDELARRVNSENIVTTYDESNPEISSEVLQLVRERKNDRNRRLGKNGLFQTFSDVVPNKSNFINFIRTLKNLGSSIFTDQDSNLENISIDKFVTAFDDKIANPRFVLRKENKTIKGWGQTPYTTPIMLYLEGDDNVSIPLGAMADNGQMGRLDGVPEFDQLMQAFKLNGSELVTRTMPLRYINFPFDSSVRLPNKVNSLKGAKAHWGKDFNVSNVYISTQEIDKEGHSAVFDPENDAEGDFTYSGKGFILVSATMSQAQLNHIAEASDNATSLDNLQKLSQTNGEFIVLRVSNQAVGVSHFVKNVTKTAYGVGKSDTEIARNTMDLMSFLGWDVDLKGTSRPVIDNGQFSNEYQAPYILSQIVSTAPSLANYVNTLEGDVKTQAVRVLHEFLGGKTSPARFFLNSAISEDGDLIVKSERTSIPLRQTANTGNDFSVFLQAIDAQAIYMKDGTWHTALPTTISVTTLAGREDSPLGNTKFKFVNLGKLEIAAEKDPSINLEAIKTHLNSYHKGGLELESYGRPVKVTDGRRAVNVVDADGNETEEFAKLRQYAPDLNWQEVMFNSGFRFEGLPFVTYMGLLDKASKNASPGTKGAITKGWKSQITFNGNPRQWSLNLKRSGQAKGGITKAKSPNGMDEMIKVKGDNDIRVPNPIISVTPFLDIMANDGVTPVTEEEPVETQAGIAPGMLITNGNDSFVVNYDEEGQVILYNMLEDDEGDNLESKITPEQLQSMLESGFSVDDSYGEDIEYSKEGYITYDPISHEQAALILNNIFGVDQWSDFVQFRKDLAPFTGNLGLVAREMLYLHSADGVVDRGAVKHEPIHYILSYFLEPAAYKKILTTAKSTVKSRKWLRGQFGLNKGDEVTDTIAHEFLAKAYEGFDKSQEWKALPKFIQNTFRWLRNAWYRFSHGSKVTDFFTQVEGGKFRDASRRYRNDIIDGEEAIFTKENPKRGRAIEALSKIEWKWGNAVNLQNHIDELRKATVKQRLDFRPTANKSKTLIGAYNSAVHSIAFGQGGIDVRKGHLQQIRDNKYRDYNNYTAEKASEVLAGSLGADERSKYKGYLTYKYKRLLMTAIFPELSIQNGVSANKAMQILTYLDDTAPSLAEGQSTTNKINTSFEQSKVNAFRTMSQDVKDMIGSTRLLTLENGKLNNVADQYIDDNWAKSIFIDAFAEVRNTGQDLNLDSVKSAFRTMISSSLEGSKKDTALSIYLRFFASVNEKIGGYEVNEGQFEYSRETNRTATEGGNTKSEYSFKSVLDYLAINRETNPELEKLGWDYAKLYEGAISSMFSAYASVTPKNFWIAKINDDATITDQLDTISYNAVKEFRRRFEGQINQALFAFSVDESAVHINSEWVSAIDNIGEFVAIRQGKNTVPAVKLANGDLVVSNDVHLGNPQAIAAMTNVFAISGMDNITSKAIESAFEEDSNGALRDRVLAGEMKTLFFRLMATPLLNEKGEGSHSVRVENNIKGATGATTRLHDVIATSKFGGGENIGQYFRDSDNYADVDDRVVTPTSDIHNMENLSKKYFGDIKSPFIDLSFYNEKGEMVHTMTLGNDMTNKLSMFNNHEEWISANGGNASSFMNELYTNPLLSQGKIGVMGELSHVKTYNDKGVAADNFVEGDHLLTRFKYLFIDPVMEAVRNDSDANFFMATTKRADKPHLYAVQLFNSSYNESNKSEGTRQMYRSMLNTAVESLQRYKQNFPDWGLAVQETFADNTSNKALVDLIKSDFKIVEKNLESVSPEELKLTTLDKKLDVQKGKINKVLLADVLAGTKGIQKQLNQRYSNLIKMIDQSSTLKGRNWDSVVTNEVDAHYGTKQIGYYNGDINDGFNPSLVHPALAEYFYSTAFNQYFFDEAGTGSYYQTSGIDFDVDIDKGKFDNDQYETSKERMYEEYVKRGSSQTTPVYTMLTGTRTGVPNNVNAITIEDAPWKELKEATDGIQFATGVMMEMMNSSYGGDLGIGVNPFAKPKTSGFIQNKVGDKVQLIRHYDKNGLEFITGELAAKYPVLRQIAEVSLLGKDPAIGQAVLDMFNQFEAEDDGVDPFKKLHKWLSYDLEVTEAEQYKENMIHFQTMTSARKMGQMAVHQWEDIVPGNTLNTYSYNANDVGIVLELTHETVEDVYASLLTQLTYIAGTNRNNNHRAKGIYRSLALLQKYKAGLIANKHNTEGTKYIMDEWRNIQNNMGNFSLPAKFSRDGRFTPSMPIIDSATQGVTSSLVNRSLSHKIPGDKLILAPATGLMTVFEKDGFIYQQGDNIPDGAVERELNYIEAGTDKSGFSEIITKNTFGQSFGLERESIREIFGDKLGLNLEAANFDELYGTNMYASLLQALRGVSIEQIGQLPLARTLIEEDAKASELQTFIVNAQLALIQQNPNNIELSKIRDEITVLEAERKALSYFDMETLYNPDNIAEESDQELYLEKTNSIEQRIAELSMNLSQYRDIKETVNEQRREELNRLTAEGFRELDMLRRMNEFYVSGLTMKLEYAVANDYAVNYEGVSVQLRNLKTKLQMLGIISDEISKAEKQQASLFSFTIDGEQDLNILLQKLAQRTIEFNKTLYAFVGRIPSTGMNSATPVKIVQFVHDSRNTAFIPAERNMASGSDFDGDGDTMWGYKPMIEKEVSFDYAMANSMLYDFIDIWRNNENIEAVTQSLKVDEYLAGRTEGISRRLGKLSWADPASDIILTIENDVGNQLTGASANAFKKYAYYSQAKINKTQRHKNFSEENIEKKRATQTEKSRMALHNSLVNISGVKVFNLGNIKLNSTMGYPSKDMSELYGWDNLGTNMISDSYEVLVNGSVDNASNPRYGKMNINNETLPYAEHLISMGLNRDMTFDIFQHSFTTEFFRRYRESNNIKSDYHSNTERYFEHKFLRGVFLKTNPDLNDKDFIDAFTSDKAYFDNIRERFDEWKRGEFGKIVEEKKAYRNDLDEKFKDTNFIEILDQAQAEINGEGGMDAVNYFFMTFQDISGDINSIWNINHVLSVFKELKTVPFDNWKQKQQLYRAISVDKIFVKSLDKDVSHQDQLAAVIEYFDWFHETFTGPTPIQVADNRIIEKFQIDTEASEETVAIVKQARARNRKANKRFSPWTLLEEMPHIAGALKSVILDDRMKEDNNMLQFPQIRDKFYGRAETILKRTALTSKFEYNRFINKWHQYVGGKFIENSTILRNGKPHNMLDINGVSYDLANPWQRSLYVNDFVDYINSIKTANRDKVFLNALKTSDKTLYIDRNWLMADSEKAMLIAEFDKLDDNVKTNLFYYAMTVSGLRLGSQTLTEFISQTKFYAYNDYVKSLEYSLRNNKFNDNTDWLSPENIDNSLNDFYKRFAILNNRGQILKSLNRVLRNSKEDLGNEPITIKVFEKEYKNTEDVVSENVLAEMEEEDIESAEEEIAHEQVIEVDKDNLKIYTLKVMDDAGNHLYNRLYFANWETILDEGIVKKALIAHRVQGTAPQYFNPMSDAVASPIIGAADISRVKRISIDQVRDINSNKEFKLSDRQASELRGNSGYAQILFNNVGKIDERKDGFYITKITGDFNPDMKAQKRSYLTTDVAYELVNEHINRMQEAFPEIGIKWSNEYDYPGWVQDGTVHFNPNLINLDTPYHEFGHVWLQYVKNLNNEDYKRMVSTSVESSIYDEIKKNYGELKTEEDIMEEAFMTLHGMRMTGESIVQFMPDRGNRNRFYKAVYDFLDMISEGVNKLFGKKAGAAWATNRGDTMNLWDALEYAEDAIKSNKYPRQSNMVAEKMIRFSKQLRGVHGGFDTLGSMEEFISKKRETLDKEDYANYKTNIKRKAMQRPANKEGLHTFWNSYKQEDVEATESNISEFVTRKYNARNNVASIVAEYANDLNAEKLSDLFSEKQMEKKEPLIYNWITTSRDNQFDHIVAYNEESAKELGIWNPYFKDENIVIAYKDAAITGNEMHVRLLFPSTSPLGDNAKTRLDEKFGKKTKHLHVTLRDSRYDAKLLKMGMFAASLRQSAESNNKILVLDSMEIAMLSDKGRKGKNKDKVNQRVFIQDILPSLSGLSQIENFTGNINNAELVAALKNPANMRAENYNGSYLQILGEYLMEQDIHAYDVGHARDVLRGYHQDLRKGDATPDGRKEVIDLIRERQQEVKRRNNIEGRVATEDDLNELRKDPEWNYLALAYKEALQRWNGMDMRFNNPTARLNGISQWLLAGVDIANVELASATKMFIDVLDKTKFEWKQFTKEIAPMFNTYMGKWKSQPGNTKGFAFENTSKYYENLWIREEFSYMDIDGNPSMEEMNTFKFKDPDDNSNNLKAFERDFIRGVNDVMRGWVNEHNQNQPESEQLTYRKGMMPFALAPHERVRNKIFHENTRENIKRWWTAFANDHTNYENLDLGQEASMLRDNPSGFLGQYGRTREDRDYGAAMRYEALGLEEKNGEWVISKGDLDRHQRAEDDVEALLFQVGLTTFKNKRLPQAVQAYESMRTVLMYQDARENTPLKTEKEWLDDMFRFLMFNEMRENNLFGSDIDFDKFSKHLRSLSSKVILGFAPASATVDLVASSLINLSTSVVSLYGEGMFGPENYAFASGVIIPGLVTKKVTLGAVELDTIEKMENIIEDWNLFNSDMRVMARDHRRRTTTNSWFNEEHIFFFHHEVERALTMSTFLAQIHKDKLLSYFEWKVDENDRRYLNYNIDKEIADVESGVRKHKTRTIEYLKELQQERNFNRDTEGLNLFSKSYTESEIYTLRAIKAKLTGAYEDATKGKLDTDAPRSLFASMKKYIISRANRVYRDSDYESNSIVFYENREVEYVDDNGKKQTKMMSVPVPVTETSFWGSLVAIKNQLRDIEGGYSAGKVIQSMKDLNPEHQRMLARGAMDLATFALVISSVLLIWAGEDKRKSQMAKLFTRIAFDILGAYNPGTYIQAANGSIPLIAMYKAISAIQKLMVGDVERAKYEFGGMSGVQRTIRMFND